MIDPLTGQFWSTWSSDDINFLRTRFPDGNNDPYIKIRVAVYIGGSTTQGALADKSTLVHTEFKIKFLDSTEVDSCAGN
jgi:hypothetical protein